MTGGACVQLPLDKGGINNTIKNQMITPPHDLFVQSVDLENGRKPDIVILKKDIEGVF